MVRDLAREMPELRIKLAGRMDAFLMDAKTGEIVEERHVKNTVVDAGEIWVAELLTGMEYGDSVLSYGAGELGWGIQYCQVGSNGDATTEGDYNITTSGLSKGTDGGHEFAVAMTTGVRDIISPGNEMVLTASFATFDAVGDLQEAGLFSSISTSTSKTDTSSRMFNRVNFATISKDTSYTLTFEWHITIGSVT